MSGRGEGLAHRRAERVDRRVVDCDDADGPAFLKGDQFRHVTFLLNHGVSSQRKFRLAPLMSKRTPVSDIHGVMMLE